MRYLNVNDVTIPLLDEDADRLNAADVIYPCGDPDHDHDYHINPEDTSLTGVEDLAIAIFNARLMPSLESSGIETILMKGEISGEMMDGATPDELAKRRAYITRNLSLNIATTAQKRGMFGVEHRTKDGKMNITTSLTVIPAGKRRDFAFLAKGWVIGLIKALPGVSDQRKDEAIALIQQA